MKLPKLNRPEMYQGLYVFDFSDHVAVGYTAEEIEVLLSSPDHCNGRAFKIHHATPDGVLSLRQLSRLDCSARQIMTFFRNSQRQAREDFETLKAAAARRPPPTIVRWTLAYDSRLDAPHYTELVYAAEYSDTVSRWLQDTEFEGGDRVEGRPQATQPAAAEVQRDEVTIGPDPRFRSRPPRVVLETVHQPIQRRLD